MAPPLSYVIYADAQPTPDAWAAAQELAERWNEEHESQWMLVEAGDDRTYEIEFDDETLGEQDALEALLDEYRAARRVQVRRYGVVEPPPEEAYADAEFVHLYGVELHGQSVQFGPAAPEHTTFVVNEAEAWEPGRPCPACDFADPVFGRQCAELVVDEWFLDRHFDEQAGEWRDADRAWDVIWLPGPVTLLSARAVAALRDKGLRGMRERAVGAVATGSASERVTQVEPERWVTGVCPEHSELDGDQCPECGRVLGRLGGRVHLLRDTLGDADLVGRRAGVRLVYFSRRVRHILEAIDAQGLLVGDPIYLCDHP